MSARWYNPGGGDFTSADTVSMSPDPDSAAGNPFAYAADRPLEPTGHYIVPPGGTEGAGTNERRERGLHPRATGVADVATARIVEQAVITAPTSGTLRQGRSHQLAQARGSPPGPGGRLGGEGHARSVRNHGFDFSGRQEVKRVRAAPRPPAQTA
jgi:hypothetical protein